MGDDGTLGEPTAATVQRARLLTFVLDYDDLLAPDTQTFRLDDRPLPVTIGRASTGPRAAFVEASALRLRDPWMSGGHATLDRRGDADVLSDGGSRNGTWVNGERIREHRLADGDLVEVGHSLLVYRVVPAPLAAALDESRPLAPLGPTRTWAPRMAALWRDLRRVAPSTEPVLVLAETGAGKEIVARAIHELSGRRGQLRTVDCGAIPETLFEATFFGHRRGAFTGAVEASAGEIVRADGGTLFVDEIANLDPAAQAALLRVVEDGRVAPVGSTDRVAVDVRWIAATNRDLLADPKDFRADLVQRLSGYVARLPPLRERREDLGELTAHLLRDAGVTRASITAPAARQLFAGELPGNVRQLRATLRTACLLAAGAAIDSEHLPAHEPPEKDARKAPDAAAIESALARSKGNVVRAAEILETHPRQLYRWLDKLAIPLDRFRRGEA